MQSLTSALDGGEWSASRRGHFPPEERAPGNHWIGGWVSPRTGLDTVEKRIIPSPRRESNPDHPIVHPVVSRYTDWTIPAFTNNSYSFSHLVRRCVTCEVETASLNNVIFMDTRLAFLCVSGAWPSIREELTDNVTVLLSFRGNVSSHSRIMISFLRAYGVPRCFFLQI
jgi:hypothetical protein